MQRLQRQNLQQQNSQGACTRSDGLLMRLLSLIEMSLARLLSVVKGKSRCQKKLSTRNRTTAACRSTTRFESAHRV